MKTSSDLKQSLDLFEFAPGRKASWRALGRVLKDLDTLLFFAKALNMPYATLSEMTYVLFKSSVVNAFLGQADAHSSDLQSYVIDTLPPDVYAEIQRPDLWSDSAPKGELLPAVWDSIDVVIAKSIATVIEKLSRVLDALPSKEGSMVFEHAMKMNRQRPTIGTYGAAIKHQLVPDVLVILDVSGSMSASTISQIVDDVVAMSWKANAHMAIVSNSAFHWEPGTYNVADILRKAEYGGTQYEMLTPLLQKDWGTVITVADYDSSNEAKRYIANNAKGRIGQVLDISLVNRPTFLAECVGQLADDVRPILIGSSGYVLA